MKLALVAGVAMVACGSSSSPPPPPQADTERLAAYLRGVAALDDAARAREVATWKLDEPAFRRTVVKPFDGLYADYARAFDAAVPELVAAAARATSATARRHYALEPGNSVAQDRLRWVFPVQAPSLVATSFDTVFVADGSRWRALAGLDDVIIARVRALDPACAARLDRVRAAKRCADVGSVVVDAAVRADSSRFEHACQLAARDCGTQPP